MTGCLYIVATPIGNRQDITFRAVEILSEVDMIYCEDTRHSRPFLQHYQINTALKSYHDHNENQLTPHILSQLAGGKHIALISDAGTPLISDPGYRLVHEARNAGLRVCPIPGASAVIAALCASGLPTDQWQFVGFLPTKQKARQATLTTLLAQSPTLICYESPKRITASLADAAAIAPKRETVIARELTKHYEECLHGNLQDLANQLAESPTPKGEIVWLIAGQPAAKMDEAAQDKEARALLLGALEHTGVKQAAAIVSSQTGLPKRQLYSLALTLKAGED